MINVPYFTQHDNKSGRGYRECFSSSCAMLAAFYKKVSSDDEYNGIRSKYGDTTSSSAQLLSLRELDLYPLFITNATATLLSRELKAGRPVAVGWLHHGPADRPSGGGHWSVVIGETPTHWIIHDPNGEADLVNGGYVNRWGGRAVAYSKKNFNKRWLVEGPSSGWAVTCQPNHV